MMMSDRRRESGMQGCPNRTSKARRKTTAKKQSRGTGASRVVGGGREPGESWHHFGAQRKVRTTLYRKQDRS